jgi:hypothetical protein
MRFLVVSFLITLMALTGCRNNLPPAQRLMEPGPGVGGPGPGIRMNQPYAPANGSTSQIYFAGPVGMDIVWDVCAPGMFDSIPLVCPGRYNFPQGAIYRLKLYNIPGREDVELYPTLEVAATMPRSEAFLAHNAIPVQFTPEDIDQAISGNFVTKVVYLPDPEFQAMAVAGVGELVSTRLEAGVDPIVEADRRGAIMAVIRIGNKDLHMEGTYADNAVTKASYNAMAGCPTNGPMAGPASYVSGVTAPQYGMPISGTPIGLAGPPHVPLGIPAGLQQHKIVNHTPISLPNPTEHVRIDVRQDPGFRYPKPANHVNIVEKTGKGLGWFFEPLLDHVEAVRRPDAGENCNQ